MGLPWKECDAGSYLATGNDDNTVRMWQVTEEDGKPHFKLPRSSPHSSLNVKDANVQNAHGLTRMQNQLPKQRGNVGEPIPPMSIHTLGEKLTSKAAAVNRTSKMSKKELLDDRGEDTTNGGPEQKASQTVAFSSEVLSDGTELVQEAFNGEGIGGFNGKLDEEDDTVYC
ncbi:hypothetical protein BGZ72_001318 [Mortierella alpina]|nr:hypothetical protein BGZ72_001318 [Mortierella alpina]